MSAPRIYNLFPLLVGGMERWHEHLPRIAGMGFDWVYINPFHYPGFSGSLYAVKDYYRLHPLLQGDSRLHPDEMLGGFLEAAHGQGLRVMMDLVINHTSKDALLVEERPEWYLREADGSLHSPFAADPDDPDNVEKRTVWGDLAELDYGNAENRQAMIRYWSELVRHYAGLGFDGFRCDAAYKVPGEVWSHIIQAARHDWPGSVFFAETLGCQPQQVTQLVSAGFDYLFNSSKWWDFRAPWLLEQYALFRTISPSIAFPESHDTPRLADEFAGDERVSRLRYLFAAAFSSGVMMPVGYEYGFLRALHVVETRPESWEHGAFDISAFIAAVNRMKAASPVLNEEGPQYRLSKEDEQIVVLLRESETHAGKVLTLINPDAHMSHTVAAAFVAHHLGCAAEDFIELMPGQPCREGIELPPLSIRLFSENIADPSSSEGKSASTSP